MENSLKETYNGIFTKLLQILNKVGSNSLKDNYKFWEIIPILTDSFFYLYVNFYSLWYYREDFIKVASILVPSGYAYQAFFKYYLLISKRKILVEINQIIIDFYNYIENGYSRYIAQLNKNLNLCIYVINGMRKIYYLSACILVMYPIIIMIITKELTFPYNFVLPGLNYETHPGFEINFIFQLLQTYLVVFFVAGTDALCLLYVYNGCLQVEAIILMLEELNGLLEDPGSNKENIENILNDIIETYQIQRKYMLIIDDVYNMGYMVLIATDMLENALVLIVMTMEFWFLGLIFIISATTQIFLVCFLGTYIVIIHENLEHAIYNIKWYSLELKQQKYILLMLLLSQKPTNLSVGGMVMMDLNTFVQIYKTIYSFFMMLQNMRQN